MTPAPTWLAGRDDVRALLGLGTGGTATVRPVGARTLDDGVVLTSLVLEASDGRAVPMLVLTPPGAGPWPGAVAIHQHNDEFHVGKAEPAGLAGDPTMAYGRALARRGVVVAVPDLAGFEDRRRRPRTSGDTGDGAPVDGLDDGGLERLAAFHDLALGTTLLARHVADVSLAVGHLLTRPDVDGDRVGLVGHSLGGQVGLFTAACDPRVSAAVLSCGVGTLASFDREQVLHNPSWYVPGLIALGDVPAVAAVTDVPVRLSAGRSDPLFPLDGVEQVAAAFPDAVLTTFDGGHAFPPDVAGPALGWLARTVH